MVDESPFAFYLDSGITVIEPHYHSLLGLQHENIIVLRTYDYLAFVVDETIFPINRNRIKRVVYLKSIRFWIPHSFKIEYLGQVYCWYVYFVVYSSWWAVKGAWNPVYSYLWIVKGHFKLDVILTCGNLKCLRIKNHLYPQSRADILKRYHGSVIYDLGLNIKLFAVVENVDITVSTGTND